MGQLLVYSASAGSGKTHNIAGQYILLLFSKRQAHRNILAVTFTNKACDEMKDRIVNEMYKISSNNASSERINEIKDFTGLPESKIKEISKDIFRSIIHDYSFFSVSTIDSFFQKIVKSFTRETGIQYNYEIELDTDSVISKAVDDLLVLSENDKKLRNDIISIIEENIKYSQKWDFRRELKEFIKKVVYSDFRKYEEDYRNFFNKKKSISVLNTQLNIIEKDFTDGVVERLKEVKSILDSSSITPDSFKGKSRSIINRLLKTESKLDSGIDIDSHFKDVDNIEAWLLKSSIDKEPIRSITNKLILKSLELKEFMNDGIKPFTTSKIVRKQLKYAALIDKILQTIKENLYEDGKFLISEIPVFLSEIANQNDASFIYEKSGTYYENYLIDEFQDTSRLQWDSFKPLLSESLSSGDDKQINILVGDLKQSIYSWRGGDWSLLASQVHQEYGSFIKEINLSDNWRSGKNIVDFNNSFFKSAAEILENHINSNFPKELHKKTGDLICNSVYNNIYQNVKQDFDSLVQIDIFDKTPDYQEGIVRNLISQIEDLQSKNYRAGDIMILVRKHKEGSFIANEILNYSKSNKAKPNVVYDVISSEALFISSNRAVKLIIACLKYLADNSNELAFIEAAYAYYIFSKVVQEEDIPFSKEDFVRNLEDKLSTLTSDYSYSLLHELVDKIILSLELNTVEENIPFLNSFKDLIHEYSQKKDPEVNSFLEYWDEHGENQNLHIPEKQDAINIITVHKAKGLAADFVFVPFCDWNTHQSNDIIWTSSDIPPFDKLPVWPVNLSEKLKHSYFSESFYLDIFRQNIESFNMLYVAYTRARKGLYISGHNKPSKNSIQTIVNKTIETITASDKSNFKIIEEENHISYKCGEIPDTLKEKHKTNYLDSYQIFLPNKQIRIKPFYDKDKQEGNQANEILEGIIFHKIFENIIHLTDIEKSISQIINKGQIIESEKEKYRENILKYITHNFTKSWFDGTYTVNNEIEIADSNGFIRRPDRIMQNKDEIIIVDYKFGNLENKKYIRQTSDYAKLLRKMGYTNIKTYIWFVLNEYLLEVDDNSLSAKKIDLTDEKAN